VPEQTEGELLASDLVGQPLYDTSGGRLGDTTDVLFDREHRLKALVIALEGGGPQGKRVAIPFEAVHRVSVNNREVRLVAQVDPTLLRDTKGFEALAKQAAMDDNQDLTSRGRATGGSVPPTR